MSNACRYRLIAESIEPYCDVFLCETMSTAHEALAAATAAIEVGNGKPVSLVHSRALSMPAQAKS